MKAMIFAAGLGTRLKPYTDSMPKALVPVAGKPMIWHQVRKLKAAGVDSLVINVHHFAPQLVSYIHSENDFGITVHISDESGMLLDTGGGLLAARAFLEQGTEPFLVHNVDIFSDVNLSEFIAGGLRQNSIAKLLVSDRDSSRKLLFDSRMRLCGWKNLKTGELRGPLCVSEDRPLRELAFGGVHLISPGIFRSFDRHAEFSGSFGIVDAYLGFCAEECIEACCPARLNLIDAGKPDSLSKIENSLFV